MKIKRFTLSQFEMNSYLIIKEGQAVIIDVGSSPEPIINYLEQHNITLKAILLTHTHLDHIAGLNYLREQTKAPVYVHEKEQDWLQNPNYNGSKRLIEFFGEIITKPAEHIIKNDTPISIGPFEIKAVFTPGHTPGGISYYLKPYIFTGDTLFYRSIGRTDLFGGDYPLLLKTIKANLLTMPSNTVIYPGHGEKSTIGEEVKFNPFLK